MGCVGSNPLVDFAEKQGWLPGKYQKKGVQLADPRPQNLVSLLTWFRSLSYSTTPTLLYFYYPHCSYCKFLPEVREFIFIVAGFSSSVGNASATHL